jgi:hypothetical protein
MDPNRATVEDLMRRDGLDEREAAAKYHLLRAHDVFTELLEDDVAAKGEDRGEILRARIRDETRVSTHFSALYRALAVRVVQRDHPDGWRP